MKRVIIAWFCLMTGGATFAETVVAAKVIRAGQIISQEDLRLASGRAGGDFSAFEELLGLEAHVTIYPGRSIRRKDIGSPALVDRNQLIKIHYISGPLQIFAEGRALSRGAKGDVIRVMNLASRAVVTARILPDGRVVAGGSD